MKAEDIDPSANNSRSRLGIRYATKKASAAGVAPKSLANTISRINPRTRLEKVATPIIPAAFTTERVSSCTFTLTGGARVGSGINQDSKGTTPISLSRRRLRFLNQSVRQLVWIIARAGRADLREKRPALRNRFADGVGCISASDSVENSVDEAVPGTGRHAIVDPFIR